MLRTNFLKAIDHVKNEDAYDLFHNDFFYNINRKNERPLLTEEGPLKELLFSEEEDPPLMPFKVAQRFQRLPPLPSPKTRIKVANGGETYVFRPYKPRNWYVSFIFLVNVDLS